MFIRVTLLLLLAHAFFPADAIKIQNVLKDIGKRYAYKTSSFMGQNDMAIMNRQYRKNRNLTQEYEEITGLTEYDSWKNMDEEGRNEIRNTSARWFMARLIDTSSYASSAFRGSFALLENRMLFDEFKADVCAQKTMNAYQYLRHLLHQGSQGYFVERFGLPYEIVPQDDRDLFRFKFNFSLYDDTMQYTHLEYDVLLKVKIHKGHIFHLSSIHQGGTCLNYGEVDHTKTEFEGLAKLVDDIEGIKENPTFKKFSELLSPASHILEDENPNNLPMWWLSGINETSDITVCHEDKAMPVKYSEAEFRSWYNHFGIMWHAKNGSSDSDTYQLQVTTLKTDEIIGRVTMNLQMGVKEDANVIPFEFKFHGVPSAGNHSHWSLIQLVALCDSTIHYKDQSLQNVRDIIGQTFLTELKNQNDTQWYSTPEFIQLFTKHGHVDLIDCASDQAVKTTRMNMFNKHDKKNIHGTKFTKYWINTVEAPKPAPDVYSFQMKTISRNTDEYKHLEWEHDWVFDLKWDPMDQFYYIEKMEISCATSVLASQLEFQILGK